jgi:hypothetical protein
MFIESDGVDTLRVAILLVAALGLIVGFAWIRRITSPDDQPLTWRYRRARIRRRPTLGWIATRIQMGIAVLVFVLVVTAPIYGFGGLELSQWVQFAPIPWFVAIAMAGIGTLWIFRILRADPEPDTKAWRYRGR